MTRLPLLARIAVAVDLAPGSRRLLAHGLRLARDAGAELVVVHADAPHEPAGWHIEQVLAELCACWQVDPVPVVQVRAHGPDPATAVVQAAEQHGPDLLIVGSERRRGIDLLLRASVGERIARAFSVGTLIVGRDQPGIVDIDTGRRCLQNVLLPVGPGVQAQDALDAAASFLAAVDARDAVVHPLFVGPLEMPFPELSPPAWLRLDPRRREGLVIEGIVGEALEVRADLVLMATHGHDSVVDALIGTRTERVQRLAPCAVLAVPLRLD